MMFFLTIRCIAGLACFDTYQGPTPYRTEAGCLRVGRAIGTVLTVDRKVIWQVVCERREVA